MASIKAAAAAAEQAVTELALRHICMPINGITPEIQAELYADFCANVRALRIHHDDEETTARYTYQHKEVSVRFLRSSKLRLAFVNGELFAPRANDSKPYQLAAQLLECGWLDDRRMYAFEFLTDSFMQSDRRIRTRLPTGPFVIAAEMCAREQGDTNIALWPYTERTRDAVDQVRAHLTRINVVEDRKRDRELRHDALALGEGEEGCLLGKPSRFEVLDGVFDREEVAQWEIDVCSERGVLGLAQGILKHDSLCDAMYSLLHKSGMVPDVDEGRQYDLEEDDDESKALTSAKRAGASSSDTAFPWPPRGEPSLHKQFVLDVISVLSEIRTHARIPPQATATEAQAICKGYALGYCSVGISDCTVGDVVYFLYPHNVYFEHRRGSCSGHKQHRILQVPREPPP